MKGVTPVLAVILLLFMTVVIVGMASGTVQRILGLAGKGAETQAQAAMQKAAQTINIDNAVAQSVTVRNSGTENIPTTEITVFVGGAMVECGNWAGDATMEPKTMSTCTWTGTPCSAGIVLRAVAHGNEDSRTC